MTGDTRGTGEAGEPRTPEEAADEARRRARERVAAGDYGQAAHFEALGVDTGSARSRLQRWVAIEVDPAVVRSTRRAGAPITAFKRFLVRMLLQYHKDEHAQITRFNAHLLGYVVALEERVAELERRLAQRDGTPPR